MSTPARSVRTRSAGGYGGDRRAAATHEPGAAGDAARPRRRCTRPSLVRHVRRRGRPGRVGGAARRVPRGRYRGGRRADVQLRDPVVAEGLDRPHRRRGQDLPLHRLRPRRPGAGQDGDRGDRRGRRTRGPTDRLHRVLPAPCLRLHGRARPPLRPRRRRVAFARPPARGDRRRARVAGHAARRRRAGARRANGGAALPAPPFRFRYRAISAGRRRRPCTDATPRARRCCRRPAGSSPSPRSSRGPRRRRSR